MKNFISLLMSIVILLSMTACLQLTAQADPQISEDGDFCYTTLYGDDSQIYVCGYFGTDTNVVIPSIIDGKTVVGLLKPEISVGYYIGFKRIISITLPDTISVYSFSDHDPFGDCNKLKEINVNETNKNFSSENGVLFNKSKTKLVRYPIGKEESSYTIPDGVLYLNTSAFSDCDNVTELSLPRTLKAWDNSPNTSIDSLRSCSNLKSISVPDNSPAFHTIDGVLFDRDMTTLIIYPKGNERTKYAIPDGVNRVTSFSGCTSLASVTIPNSVTNIGGGAFYGCTSLTSVTISNSVTSIGDSAFEDCTSLASVTIPNSVTSIGDSAFEGCTSLTNITIPNSVTSMGYGAFEYCTSLTSVTISNSVTSIGEYVFHNCTSLKDIYYTGTKDEWDKISIGYDNECLTNATIHYNSFVDDPTPQPPVTEPNVDPTPQPPTPSEPVTPPSNTEPEVPSVPTVTQPSTVPQPATIPSTPAVSEPATFPATTPTASTTEAPKTVSKPKSTKIKKATGSKKAIAITWAKVTGIKGYEVQVATDKKFKKNKKTVTIKKQKTTKTTVKKLKAKKKYYVRIRTYKTVNGKKVYSSWSKTKTVKTK